MAREYRFVVGPAEAGQRLDRYLVSHLPSNVSRTMVQHGVARGAVTVNSQPAKSHRSLKAGDVVTARCDWLPAAPTDLTITPQPIPLDIIHEDSALLVVNKPAGLVTHPAPGHWDGTLVNAILWHLQEARGLRLEAEGKGLQPRASSLQPPRAGLVHRLDKDTSGLLLIAKTPTAHVALSRQLKHRTLSRRYLAIVEGDMPHDRGTVDASIGRHPVHRKIMTVKRLGGRSAVSHYRVLKRSANPPALSYTVLEVSLETGRTHQIRVHVAHVGHPVLGDIAYGHRSAGYWASVGIARQMLHAYQVTFQHPVTREMMTLKAEPPADMKPWLA